MLHRSYVAPATPARPDPRRPAARRAAPRSGSFHGGRWVRTSRRTPAAVAACPAWRAGEVQVGRRVVVAAGLERGLDEREVGAAAELDQRVARAGVGGVGQHRAVVLDPHPPGLDRVRHPGDGHGERADLVAARASTREVERRGQARVARPARRRCARCAAPPAGHVDRAAGRSGAAGRRCGRRRAAAGRCSGRGAGG